MRLLFSDGAGLGMREGFFSGKAEGEAREFFVDTVVDGREMRIGDLPRPVFAGEDGFRVLGKEGSAPDDLGEGECGGRGKTVADERVGLFGGIGAVRLPDGLVTVECVGRGAGIGEEDVDGNLVGVHHGELDEPALVIEGVNKTVAGLQEVA